MLLSVACVIDTMWKFPHVFLQNDFWLDARKRSQTRLCGLRTDHLLECFYVDFDSISKLLVVLVHLDCEYFPVICFEIVQKTFLNH